MKILDIINSPWAIPASKYTEIRDIYLRHVQREKVDLKAIEAEYGRPFNNEQRDYDVIDGVAILSIEGVIAKGMSLLTRISGGTSNALLARDFKQALEDPMVKAVIFAVDSPGGTVSGTQELMNLIYGARGMKPVIAITDGMMASAAYWIASAADEIYITGDTTQVGSIGVVASHTDISKREEQMGVKTTEITGGKYKRIASEYRPLSKEGLAYLQAMVDDLYTVFVNDVARNRAFGADKLQDLNSWAEGRIFIGTHAIDAGLVDGVSTIDRLIESLAAGEPVKARTTKQRASSGGAPVAAQTGKEEPMTKEKLKAEFPEVFDAVFENGRAQGKQEGNAEGIMEGRRLAAKEKAAQDDGGPDDGGPMCDGCKCGDCDEEDDAACKDCEDNPEAKGAKAECGRIKGVLAQSMPGHDKLVIKMMFDGKTTPEQAAVQILKAEKGIGADVLAGIEEDGRIPNSVPSAQGGDDEGNVEQKRQAAIEAYKKANPSATANEAYLGAYRANPALFKDR